MLFTLKTSKDWKSGSAQGLASCHGVINRKWHQIPADILWLFLFLLILFCCVVFFWHRNPAEHTWSTAFSYLLLPLIWDSHATVWSSRGQASGSWPLINHTHQHSDNVWTPKYWQVLFQSSPLGGETALKQKTTTHNSTVCHLQIKTAFQVF